MTTSTPASPALASPVPASLVTVVSWVYEALLDRQAEPGAEVYWMDRINAGLSTRGFADAVMASPEFQARHGTPNDSAFINLLYANLFERAPDMDGWGYWTGHLGMDLSRAQMVEHFVTSPENQRNPVIAAAAPAPADYWFS